MNYDDGDSEQRVPARYIRFFTRFTPSPAVTFIALADLLSVIARSSRASVSPLIAMQSAKKVGALSPVFASRHSEHNLVASYDFTELTEAFTLEHAQTHMLDLMQPVIQM